MAHIVRWHRSIATVRSRRGRVLEAVMLDNLEVSGVLKGVVGVVVGCDHGGLCCCFGFGLYCFVVVSDLCKLAN